MKDCDFCIPVNIWAIFPSRSWTSYQLTGNEAGRFFSPSMKREEGGGRNEHAPAIPPDTESKIPVWDSAAGLVEQDHRFIKRLVNPGMGVGSGVVA